MVSKERQEGYSILIKSPNHKRTKKKGEIRPKNILRSRLNSQKSRTCFCGIMMLHVATYVEYIWYGRCLSCILSLYRLCYFLISKVSKRKGWIFARKKMPHSSRRGWNKVEQVKRKVKDELGMCLMMVTSMYWIWASLERREWSNGDQIGKRNSCVPVPVATDRGWDKISGDLTCKWGRWFAFLMVPPRKQIDRLATAGSVCAWRAQSKHVPNWDGNGYAVKACLLLV